MQKTIITFVFIILACALGFGAGWIGRGLNNTVQSVFGTTTADVSDIERRDKDFTRLFDKYQAREREFDKSVRDLKTQLQLVVNDRNGIAIELEQSRTEARGLTTAIEQLGKSYTDLANRFASLKQSITDGQSLIDGIVGGTRRIDESARRALDVIRTIQNRSDENNSSATR